MCNASKRLGRNAGGGRGWIRTTVGASQRVYSASPLAARAPVRGAGYMAWEPPTQAENREVRGAPHRSPGLTRDRIMKLEADCDKGAAPASDCQTVGSTRERAGTRTCRHVNVLAYAAPAH